MINITFLILLTSISFLHAGDAEQGKKVFRLCSACHYADKNTNKVGPSLLNVIGRQAGSLEGYKYSPAMVDAGKNGLVWSRDTLIKYLHNPREMVKGTRMASIKVEDDNDIDNIIAYLQSVASPK